MLQNVLVSAQIKRGRMEVLDTPDTALVILSFLQADFKGAEFRDELLSLGQELSQEFHLKGSTDASPDDGYLETDGSRTSCITFRLHGVEPAEGPQRPGEFCVGLGG